MKQCSRHQWRSHSTVTTVDQDSSNTDMAAEVALLKASLQEISIALNPVRHTRKL
jgi:hypothetical protein